MVVHVPSVADYRSSPLRLKKYALVSWLNGAIPSWYNLAILVFCEYPCNIYMYIHTYVYIHAYAETHSYNSPSPTPMNQFCA